MLIILVFLFFPVTKLILCDSIPKYVNKVKATVIQPFPGINIARLKDKIAFNNIKVKGYKAILLHVGTNDIPPSRQRNAQQGLVSPIDSIVNSYKHLISVIRRFNANCLIVISAIIHRPVDFLLTHYRVKAVNLGLQHMCEGSTKLIFNPTYKFFLYKGEPDLQYYAGDKLHLNGGGVLRIQQAFQQALSDVNLKKANHCRHSGWGRADKDRPGR